MLTLALETSTPLGGLAIGDEMGLIAECTLGVRATHSETVLDEVARVVARAGRRPPDIGRVVVGAGPGSFTGVRIAASLAKGLCYALDIPLYAYSSLRAVAAASGTSPLCALFDARRGEVYAAAYEDPAAEAVLEPGVAPIEDVLARLEPTAAWSFAGEGAEVHREAIASQGGTVLPAHLGVPRAAALLWLVERRPEGRIEDRESWEPGYVRASGAERGATRDA